MMIESLCDFITQFTDKTTLKQTFLENAQLNDRKLKWLKDTT